MTFLVTLKLECGEALVWDILRDNENNYRVIFMYCLSCSLQRNFLDNW